MNINLEKMLLLIVYVLKLSKYNFTKKVQSNFCKT